MAKQVINVAEERRALCMRVAKAQTLGEKVARVGLQFAEMLWVTVFPCSEILPETLFVIR